MPITAHFARPASPPPARITPAPLTAHPIVPRSPRSSTPAPHPAKLILSNNQLKYAIASLSFHGKFVRLAPPDCTNITGGSIKQQE